MSQPRSVDGISFDTMTEAIRGCRVLYVEDQDVHRTLIGQLLRQAGMQVSVAEHGKQALAVLADEAVDLILMDCQMPVMDGFTATQQIRQQHSQGELPILALTATTGPLELARIEQVGMNAMVAKPIDPAQLFKLIYQWLPEGCLLMLAAEKGRARDSTYLNKTEVLANGDPRSLLAGFMATCVKDMMQLKQAQHDLAALQLVLSRVGQATASLGARELTKLAESLAQPPEALPQAQRQKLTEQLIRGYQALIKEVSHWQQELRQTDE